MLRLLRWFELQDFVIPRDHSHLPGKMLVQPNEQESRGHFDQRPLRNIDFNRHLHDIQSRNVGYKMIPDVQGHSLDFSEHEWVLDN